MQNRQTFFFHFVHPGHVYPKADLLQYDRKAFRSRKNALFYKTMNGARVGDLFMSLIHTCELSDANPFDYLTQLQRHASELAESPRDWMPWNYCARLAQLDTAA